MYVNSVFDQITVRSLTFAAEFLTFVPWLWLASVMMMNWPQIRPLDSPLPGSLSIALQGRVWKSTVRMALACLIVALALATLVLSMGYLAEATGGVITERRGRLIDAVPFLAVILLSRYGVVIHGLSIDKPISVRRGRGRLKGRSWRLFWTILVIVGAAQLAYWPLASESGWGGGAMQVTEADVPEAAAGRNIVIDTPIFEFRIAQGPIQLSDTAATGKATYVTFVAEFNHLFDLFMFALAMCAISEVMARAYSATETQGLEAGNQAVPTRA